MIFTHPHTEGPGVWGHREEIHNGRRRLAKNMCEVEIYAGFAPPGEWTSKLELFLGEGGFYWEVFRVSRVWLHRELSMAPGLYLHYKEVNLTLTLVTYRQKNLLYGRPWWQKQSSWWCSTIDASFRQGAIKGKWSALCENMVSNLLSVILQSFHFFGRILFSIFLAEDFRNMLWRYQTDKKFDSLRGNIKEEDAKLFFERKKDIFLENITWSLSTLAKVIIMIAMIAMIAIKPKICKMKKITIMMYLIG